MSLQDLLSTSRSYRSFDPSQPIGKETLLSIAETIRLVPSSRNLQPLKLRLVHKQDELDRVLSHTRWAGYLPECKLPPEGHAPTGYIVICFDSTLATSAEPFQRDVGICAQTILLAAAEAGYGGCMIGSFSPDGIFEALSLPSHLSPQLVIALGKPDEEVQITELPADGSIKYYRENGVHYVPKRTREELIL